MQGRSPIPKADGAEADPNVTALLRGWKVDDKTGAPKTPPDAANVDFILRVDPRWRDLPRLNAFTGQVELCGQPLEDWMEMEAAVWLSSVYGCNVSEARLHSVLCMHAAQNKYHPVQDYLGSIEWDGEARIDTFLPGYVGTEDTALTRAYGKKFLLSCCARAWEPGCKVDTVLILSGAQGARKSSLLSALAGEDWFSDSPIDVTDPKASAERMQGVWIYELGELDTFRKAEATAIKLAISSRKDKFRPAYGRNTVTMPRPCVFVGTTNEQEILNDSTGSRRFWPVLMGRTDDEAVVRDRDQLWAEAMVCYRQGQQWWLTPDEEEMRKVASLPYRAVDPWEDAIREKLNEPGFVDRDGLEIRKVLLAIEPDTGRQTSLGQKRVQACLRTLGWCPSPHRPRGDGGSRKRMWIREENEQS